MFGTIILTAMLTTSSAIAEDAGKNIASGLAAASASQMGQAIMPTLATSSAIAKSAGKGMVSGLAAATASYIPQDELSFTRSYKNSEAVDMAKGLGTLKEAPEFLYVVTDVNANMAVKCKRVWEPQSLALSPVIVELVELRKTNKKGSYEQALSHLNCSSFSK
ncbi:hypothetical protein EFU27_11010 [Vibrio cholerae]|uniref:Uncharacterized protein n=1 Tax=Yersinia ruckeri TaxID=29486 RepID=A4IU98_YERRU|nr:MULTISPECIES: hypothetical protein [Gammaproteobacteria]EAY4897085.1 hypothetical protein [Salmonella enterica]EEZ9745055.1 hypothetical protein [Escherichia coli O157]EFT0403794.1 hypothetical protein [Salmonella enterica subsp. enterica serovar Montevideo]EGR1101031.1 hypothetical protein [Vibrio cholerae]HAT0822816.1 hypothetical protein [Salmonella enterica subsp. enterica]HBW1702538.1 hypothetical protein [Klebsiella pneumoniae]